MANPWFRMYSEFATDPKVQMLSEAIQRRYVMLLCLRCSNGDVTLHDSEIAFQLRISNEEWAETKALLVSKNLIDEGNKPTAWDKRQYVSDSSAVRVAAHRAKKKLQSNVSVTPPDTETDTDTEIKPSSEGSPESGDSALLPDRCPHQEIVSLFNEILASKGLTAVIPSTWPGSKRAAALKARWRESAKRQSLDWWRGFFSHVSKSKFLMGENDRNWQPTLEWLLKRENFDKVCEGVYHRG